jgi:hypothetical protein
MNAKTSELKATVKAPEEPLMVEARKYKSAEEFIKKYASAPQDINIDARK